MIGARKKILSPASLAGFTLMEIIVSVAIFSVIILASTGIFKLVIDAQRKEISTQNVEESLKYFLEVTAKEIRAAQKSDGNCGVTATTSGFEAGTNSLGDTLSFKNYYGQCVSYFLQADAVSGGRFRVQRDSASGFISPAKIIIDTLHFSTAGTSSQPIVTINLRAHADSGPGGITTMILQTSISSRYYK